MNLIKILTKIPSGTGLYSTIHGRVEFRKIKKGNEAFPILCLSEKRGLVSFTETGHYFEECGECVLFPSENQRDWSKFKIDLPKGTLCIASNYSDFSGCINLRYYAGNGSCFKNGSKTGDTIEWKYIVPLNKFDPENLDATFQKYNYGER